MKIFINKEILERVDELLIEDFKIVPRSKYLKFLYFLGYTSANSKDDNVFFANHKVRHQFGRPIINGKRQWALDIIIKTLSDKGILHCTKYNSVKKIARTYSYSDKFLSEIQFEEALLTKVELDEKQFNDLSLEKPTDPDCIPQYNLLMSNRFQIDIVKASEWALDKLKNGQISKRKYVLYQHYIFNIFDKRIRVAKGPNVGRIFTTFNIIKRELRKFCTIDGEQLVSVDLKSSQPFLFASMLIKNYLTTEAKQFYDLICYSDVYTHFLEKWKKEDILLKHRGEIVKIENRDDAKVEFLRFLFKANSAGGRAAFDIVFELLYPELHKTLNNYKNKIKNSGQSIAMDLQKQESDLFIPVCNKFADRGCLSVHDSLYFKKDLYDEILNNLNYEFNSRGLFNYKLNLN